jgi:serine protease
MRRRTPNGLVGLAMVGALAVTGYPLARPWLPGSAPPVPAVMAGAETVPGQIEVDARDSLSEAELSELNAKYGLSLHYNSVHAQDERLFISDVAPDQEAAVLAQLRKDPRVEAAEPLGRVQAFWTPNDPRFNEQWNMKLIGAEKAWDKSRGKGIIVAVIDTGVAAEDDDKCYRARDFKETPFVKGYDFVSDDDHPNDDHGHGTHVAGTIAETTNNGEGVTGLAFEAKIMPLKVLDSFGSGNTADIADAIRYAADKGAHVINMSLGGPYPDRLMQLACQYAKKKGVLVVCAAGNSSGGPVGYPAAFPECMAVSAVGPKGDLAYYSSVGKQVAIAGPGGDRSQGDTATVLQNTVLDGAREQGDDYYGFQGTSMASPHVAAAAALVMARGVKDPADVRQILERAAKKKGPKEKYGAGILDAAKSVDTADQELGGSFWKGALAAIVGLGGIAGTALRCGVRGLALLACAPMGFVAGLMAPDLLFGWVGFASPWSLLFHSALIPLYLLWEAGSRRGYRGVSALGLGVAAHLAWDASGGHVPFGGVVPEQALPWLWVNVAIALGVALVAYRRSYSYDE